MPTPVVIFDAFLCVRFYIYKKLDRNLFRLNKVKVASGAKISLKKGRIDLLNFEGIRPVRGNRKAPAVWSRECHWSFPASGVKPG